MHDLFFTSASLENVRRIRVFGHYGPRESISGLLLEYWNGGSAAIGQFERELGSINIDQGDSIVHIRACFSHKHGMGSRSSADDNRGKMVGMTIKTASGASHEHLLLARPGVNVFVVDYYANRLQQLVRGLPMTPSGRLEANIALARPCLGLQSLVGPHTDLVASCYRHRHTVTCFQALGGVHRDSI